MAAAGGGQPLMVACLPLLTCFSEFPGLGGINSNDNSNISSFPKEGKAKILSSGRIVGDPGGWKVVRDGRTGKQKLEQQQQTVTFNKYMALENHTTSEIGEGPNSKDSKTEVSGAIPTDSSKPVETINNFSKGQASTEQQIVQANDIVKTSVEDQEEASKNMDKSQEADNEQSLENKELIINNVTSKQNVENQHQHHDKNMEMSNENAIYKLDSTEQSGQQCQEEYNEKCNQTVVEYPIIVAQENATVFPLKILQDIVSHSLVERIPQPQSQPQQSQQHSCSSSTEEVDSHSISEAPHKMQKDQLLQLSSSTNAVDSNFEDDDAPPLIQGQQVQQQNSSSNSKKGSVDENNKNREEVFLKSNKSGKIVKNSSNSIGSLPTRTSSRRGLQKNKD
uniref:Adenylyl cyclase n=1 Tax=Solanum tuberosum TaxID=4113 RepID=M0ZTL2_SOLTU